MFDPDSLEPRLHDHKKWNSVNQWIGYFCDKRNEDRAV